ncbi:MAG: hypothetical protein EU530_09145 [Promethearchaeota archaeon]|nr:MAG: hypothetical protein EU530_09145 [Candidatus Lokiarchaeota archaeon]
MGIKTAKCMKCWYVFLINGNNENITCPYCKSTSSEIDFEIFYRDIYGSGYKKSIEDLQNLLRVLSQYSIRRFFKEDVKKYKVKSRNKQYIFANSDGNEVSLQEIHEYIQNDIVLQRKLYNMWMSHYR